MAMSVDHRMDRAVVPAPPHSLHLTRRGIIAGVDNHQPGIGTDDRAATTEIDCMDGNDVLGYRCNRPADYRFSPLLHRCGSSPKAFEKLLLLHWLFLIFPTDIGQFKPRKGERGQC